MTVVREEHHHRLCRRVIIERVGDEGAEIISLAQAPDAIELRHLRSFVAVADELNFGRAAARLYLSQPALSRQVSNLERLVGCELLRRSTHRVELTLAGEALVDRARELLRNLDEAVSVTRSVGGELLARANQHWELAGLGSELAAPGHETQELREAVEALHAQFEPPSGISVRPVNAAGVAALLNSPEPSEPATILHLHGGAYMAGSAFGYRPLAGCLASAAQAGVLVPDYRLAPEHPFPAAVEDAMRAYLWMLDQGTDAAQVAVTGDSAGAGLVLSLLLTLRQQDLRLPGAAVLLCPWIDFGTDRDGLPPELNRIQHMCTEQYLAGHPADDPVVCPLNADLTGLPPMLVQAATGDPVLGDATTLVDRAVETGVDAQFELFAVDTHDFHIFWSFLPEAASAMRQAGRFIREASPSSASASEASG